VVLANISAGELSSWWRSGDWLVVENLQVTEQCTQTASLLYTVRNDLVGPVMHCAVISTIVCSN